MLHTEPATPFFRVDPAEPHPSKLTIAQRIALVINQHGGPDATVTRLDFKRAPETCSLTQADLDEHIGAATELVRNPPDRLEVYDRERRLESAVLLAFTSMPDEVELFRLLRTGGFDISEIAAFWSEIMARLGKAVTRLERPVSA